MVSTLSGSVLTTESSPSLVKIGTRLPVIAFWIWTNLLPFTIGNQRQQDAIKEDLVNKPWRPLPSKRLTPDQATLLMLVFYGLAFVSSFCLGGLKQCIGLMGLGFWYNDLKGGDRSCVTRNLINGCGYICFLSGALDVASDVATMKPDTYRWLLIIGLIIITTIQSQDVYDQAGDSLRERRTVPLVVGDTAARWSIAIPTGFWSYFCPAYWKLDLQWFLIPATIGAIVMWRILLLRRTKSDKFTFRVYNLWVVVILLQPLIKRYSEPL